MTDIDQKEDQVQEVRMDKVLRLRKLIAEGEYTVTADQLAEAMLRQAGRSAEPSSRDEDGRLLN